MKNKSKLICYEISKSGKYDEKSFLKLMNNKFNNE